MRMMMVTKSRLGELWKILLLLALLFPGGPGRAAEQPGDASALFLQAYLASQKGEQLAARGDLEGARKSYQHASALLVEVKQRFPHWQPEIVSYRERMVAQAWQNPAAAAATAVGTPRAPGGPGWKMEAKQPLHKANFIVALGSLLFTGLVVIAIISHYRKLIVLPEGKYATFAPRFWTSSVDSLVLWPLSTTASFLLGMPLPPLVAGCDRASSAGVAGLQHHHARVLRADGGENGDESPRGGCPH